MEERQAHRGTLSGMHHLHHGYAVGRGEEIMFKRKIKATVLRDEALWYAEWLLGIESGGTNMDWQTFKISRLIFNATATNPVIRFLE